MTVRAIPLVAFAALLVLAWLPLTVQAAESELALTLPASGEDIPDPEQSDIEPWDQFGQAFVTPGSPPGGSNVDDVTITVRDFQANPMPGATVEIELSSCTRLCIDPASDGLSGITNPAGVVVLNPRVGGCDNCIIDVKANGVIIGRYEAIRSTDWNFAADGAVTAGDFNYFAVSLKETQFPCSDFDGDGDVDAVDFTLFAISFKAPDVNSELCEP